MRERVALNKDIGIIGGDLRIGILVSLLAKDGYNVHVYGLENMSMEEATNIIMHEKIETLSKKVDTIISGIPLSKNGEEVYAPFSNSSINIDDVFNKIKGKTLIAGGISEHICNFAKEKNVNIIDMLENEELTILNAIPTAEGAIQVAMEESDITLHGSNCLILGFGRIGKVLAKMLQGIGAEVYCEGRKEEDLAWIEAYGYNKVELDSLDENLGKYEYIFNTIPNIILDEKRLDKVKSECLIIELASSPYGIDFEKAKEKDIKVVIAAALPGKVAPRTAAEYIKKVLVKGF
jgi:dipicolinate synthase subunit A